MAIESLFGGLLKNMSFIDIISLIRVESIRGLYNRAFSGTRPVTTGGTDDGTKEAKDDGRGTVDELNALIAMAEAHFGQDLNAMPAEDITITRGRFRKLMAIFKALREQGKSGGAEKLMHIIGKESHLQGTATKQRTSPGQPASGKPDLIDIHNVRERTNPAGKLIIRFLTDLETQDAVELLVATSITDNGKDTTAAALRATKDKVDEFIERWKEFYGQHDTALHQFAFWASTNRAALNRVMESEPAQRLWAEIEAAPEGEKRARHEAYQAFLLSMVRAYKNPTVVRAEEREAGIKPPRITLKRIVIALAIGCVLLIVIIAIL